MEEALIQLTRLRKVIINPCDLHPPGSRYPSFGHSKFAKQLMLSLNNLLQEAGLQVEMKDEGYDKLRRFFRPQFLTLFLDA